MDEREVDHEWEAVEAGTPEPGTVLDFLELEKAAIEQLSSDGCIGLAWLYGEETAEEKHERIMRDVARGA